MKKLSAISSRLSARVKVSIGLVIVLASIALAAGPHLTADRLDLTTGFTIAGSPTISSTTGTGSLVLNTSPTITGLTLTGTTSTAILVASTSLSVNGGTPLTTTNQTGTGSLALATGPTFTGVIGLNGTEVTIGAADTGVSRDAAGVVDVGNGTAGDKTGSVNGANGTFTGILTGAIEQSTIGTQIISGADFTNATVTPLTMISWGLPPTAVAKTYRYTCDFMWESTGATLVGPVFGVSISAAPVQLTANAKVTTTLAGAFTTGYLSNVTTGSQTLITSPAAGVTSTNYDAKIWGTIEGAPIAGSAFLINVASTSGTTALLNMRRGGGCTLH